MVKAAWPPATTSQEKCQNRHQKEIRWSFNNPQNTWQ
jgi:hypothetical protein